MYRLVQVQSTGYRVQGTGYRLQGTEYRVQGTEYRVQSTGYRVQGTEYRVQVLAPFVRENQQWTSENESSGCGIMRHLRIVVLRTAVLRTNQGEEEPRGRAGRGTPTHDT